VARSRCKLQGVRRRLRRGQMAVVMALVMFTLVIFMAFATNMGILVNDRIRLQNSTDLAAYSGAYTQAAALNELAYINDKILTKLIQCREELLAAPIWDGEPCICLPYNEIAEGIIDRCKEDVAGLQDDWRTAARYSNTHAEAIEAAKKTMNANLRNLYRDGGESHFFENSSGSATETGAFGEGIGEYDQMITYLNYHAYPNCEVPFGCVNFPPLPADIHPVESYFVKTERTPDIWFMAQGAGTMEVPYLDIDYSASGNDQGYFGGSSLGGNDKMYATAVAKPFDGSMGPTAQYRQDGSREFVAAGNDPSLFDTPGVFNDEMLRRMRRYIQPNYRARLAGINEWNSQSISTTPERAISSTSGFGPFNDPSRMLH